MCHCPGDQSGCSTVTKHSVNDEESALLHSRPLEEILTWTKAHLDAFLATAEVILEQNVDTGSVDRLPVLLLAW